MLKFWTVPCTSSVSPISGRQSAFFNVTNTPLSLGYCLSGFIELSPIFNTRSPYEFVFSSIELTVPMTEIFLPSRAGYVTSFITPEISRIKINRRYTPHNLANVYRLKRLFIILYFAEKKFQNRKRIMKPLIEIATSLKLLLTPNVMRIYPIWGNVSRLPKNFPKRKNLFGAVVS